MSLGGCCMRTEETLPLAKSASVGPLLSLELVLFGCSSETTSGTA